MGAVRALRAAGLGAFALGLVFTWAAHSGAGLVLALAVVGLAPALATPAVNVVIMSGVRVQRRALAFAAASASPVTALMVAGATAPVLERLIGWRSALGIGGLVAALIVLWLRGAQSQRTRSVPAAALEKVSLRPSGGDDDRGPGRQRGIGRRHGLRGDRRSHCRPGHRVRLVRRCRLCLWIDPVPSDVCSDSRPAGIGPVPRGLDDDGGRRRWGFVLLASGIPGAFVARLILVLVPGWSWIPLLVHGVTSRYCDAVAPASGVVQGAYFGGGVVGLSIMGVLVTTASYSFAWLAMGAASLVAALSVLGQERRLPPFRTARVGC